MIGSCKELHAAFRDGEKVEAVAQAALDRALPDDLNIFVVLEPDVVLERAAASQKRWDEGSPLSVLDGVPVAIKDEFDVAGYPTTAGTTFRNEIKEYDSTVVARLRAAGAVLFGKTEMTEIGIGGIGTNPGRKTPKNPHDPTRMTGDRPPDLPRRSQTRSCPSRSVPTPAARFACRRRCAVFTV